MAHPRCSYIPPATILKHLAEVKALEDMFLVTEVFSCPAYSLYLSSGSEYLWYSRLVNHDEHQCIFQVTRSSI